MTEQTNNLNTFRILYIVRGALALLGMFIFAMYAMMGSFFSSQITDTPKESELPPFDPGMIFIVIGIAGMFFMIALAVLCFLASKFIREERNMTFIQFVAGLNCITGILGILLGVFTFIELNKPEVKDLFKKENPQV